MFSYSDIIVAYCIDLCEELKYTLWEYRIRTHTVYKVNDVSIDRRHRVGWGSYLWFFGNIFIAHSFNPSSQIANNGKKVAESSRFYGAYIYGSLHLVLTTFCLLLITDLWKGLGYRPRIVEGCLRPRGYELLKDTVNGLFLSIQHLNGTNPKSLTNEI